MMAGRPQTPDGKSLVLTDDQESFLEWLVTPSPHRTGSQNDFAESIGVARSTLSRWKNDASFKRRLQERLHELNVEPDRIQEVVEAMYHAACGGNVEAAKLYLQYTGQFTPKQIHVVEDRSVRDLSDEELAAELQAAAAALGAGTPTDIAPNDGADS